MDKEKEKARVTVYLPKGMYEQIKEKADKEKRSYSATIELLIQESLSSHEIANNQK